MKNEFSRKDIVDILNDPNEQNLDDLFQKAQKKRESVFDNKLFSYGFVYFSTYCTNNCSFCYFRKDNKIHRYRKTFNEITETSEALINSGVNLIDLTSGEDFSGKSHEFEKVLSVIDTIKNKHRIPVMISPGVLENEDIDKLKDAGADWYAVYQETHNRELFSKMRLEQSYDKRMNAKLYAKDTGLLIEEGIMCGIGESKEDIADSLFTMGEIGASQMRVMSFVPQDGSPMENINSPEMTLELKIIALMRIMYPHVTIPASLDIEGISGLKPRVDAGANLVTSIIPPKSGFCGVAQSTAEINTGGRTLPEVKKVVEKRNLCMASVDEYSDYILKLKANQ